MNEGLSAVVRPARLADAEALVRIDRTSWTVTYEALIPNVVLARWIGESAAKWQAALTEIPADGPRRRWVVERGGSVLGYATTAPGEAQWLPPPEGAGELTNLYVDPGAIGTGLGRLLYEHAMADLHARGFDPLLVWAFRDNPLARRFYDRMGLTLDVPDHDWVLGDVACPIVRYRLDWPPDVRSV